MEKKTGNFIYKNSCIQSSVVGYWLGLIRMIQRSEHC